MSPVTTSIHDAVAVISIDHPPVNALAERVLLGLTSALEALTDDVRVVVIRSANDGQFIAGGDIAELLEAAGDPEQIRHHTAITTRLFELMDALPQPIVAAVGGPAVGGGLELLLCCDIVVASATAVLGTPEIKLGLIPGAGGTQRLPRRIGELAALELVLTGRLVDAAEALRIGLVTRVVEPGTVDEVTQDLARRLARTAPAALRSAKTSVRSASTVDLADGLALEHRHFLALMESPDAISGLQRFLDRSRASS